MTYSPQHYKESLEETIEFFNYQDYNEFIDREIKQMRVTNDSKFIKLLDKYFGFYHIPMAISRNYTLKYFQRNDTQYITKMNNFRFYTAQIYGKARFILFSPKEEKYLYPTKDKKFSKLNYWKLQSWDAKLERNPDKTLEEKRTRYLDRFPKFNKVKYIEIILHPGNMLYIPYGWWFTSLAVDDNIRITSSSRSIFSW